MLSSERSPLLSTAAPHERTRGTAVFLAVAVVAIAIALVLLANNYQRIPRLMGSKNEDLMAHHEALIHPGAIFLDTRGQPINAHGGGVLYHNHTYYWYGEIKVGPTYLPESNAEWGGTRVDLTGISCYSSTDLLHWEYRGNVLSAVDDISHDLYRENVAERPKVVFNERTGKFAMWLHVDSMDYRRARCGVAIGDRPEGPFEYRGSFRPNEQMARDLTVFVDDDAKAYLFTSSEDNAAIHISELSDDYLTTTGNFTRIFVGRYMEAPAVFKRDGKYYFIGSGCTAWQPNAARSAVSSSIWGPWTELSNPCRGAGANTTFHSQSTYVLPVADERYDIRYIFMADRWKEENLSDSRYVWLPLSFDEISGHPTIRWRDKWSPVLSLA
ncbi:hypothetical protein ACHAXT_002119 [Thalassiosira profunda]